jgi:hypothetical protein
VFFGFVKNVKGRQGGGCTTRDVHRFSVILRPAQKVTKASAGGLEALPGCALDDAPHDRGRSPFNDGNPSRRSSTNHTINSGWSAGIPRRL